MQTITLVAAIAGCGFGLLGAVLGVLNTWRTFDRDYVRVRISPVALFKPNGPTGFGIEVANLSSFAITVQEIGFTAPESAGPSAWLPREMEGCKLPQRMEPRTSFTAVLWVPPGRLPDWLQIGEAYVETACGKQFTDASSAEQRQLWQEALAAAQN